MRPSRGMGVISPSKMPRRKSVVKRDGPEPVALYAKGGKVEHPQGLYANIHAKQRRIAAGSGERMRRPGSPGAPTADAFKQSAKTAKR